MSGFARGLGKRKKNTLLYPHTDNAPPWVSLWGVQVNQSRRAAAKVGWLLATLDSCGRQTQQAGGHVREDLGRGISTASTTGRGGKHHAWGGPPKVDTDA